MNFTQEDIRKQFDEATYKAGFEYVKQDDVKQVQLAANLIRSQVKERGNQVFQQNIFLKSTVQGPIFQGTCTCAVHTNCKHVAAVLLNILRKKTTAGAQQSVSTPIATWLQRLRNATFGANDPLISTEVDVSEKPLKRLLYVLSPDQSDRRLFLGMCQVRFKPTGEIATALPIQDAQSLLTEKPDYIQAEDEDSIRLFIAMRGNGIQGQSLVEPRGPIGAQLLRILINRQQLYWTNSMNDIGKGLLFPLRAASSRQARLVWLETESSLRLSWEFVPQPDEKEKRRVRKQRIDYILPTEPVWYMDSLTCGELSLPTNNTGISEKDLQHLVFQAPPIPIKDKTNVSKMVIAQGLADLIPLPQAMKETIRSDIIPVPVIRLGSVQNKLATATNTSELTSWNDYLQLIFDYDGQQVFYGTDVSIMRAKGALIERIERNQELETKFLNTLQKTGFHTPKVSPNTRWSIPGVLELASQTEWMRFTTEVMPKLQKKGWVVKKTQEYRYDIAEIEDWYAQIENKKGTGKDWFNLELGIVVNKKRVSLLPLLITLIRSAPDEFDPKKLAQKPDNETLLTMLDDGVRIALPWGRIKPILRTLGELYFTNRTDESTIRLHTLDSPRLAELTNELPLHWLNGERLLETGKRLAEFDGVQKVIPPKSLKASLRDYQLEGLSWMQFLREYELAGILADDMGLGKTLQTLSHILLEKESGRLTKPALVVAPTSLMSNWKEEAERFTPELNVLVLQGKDRLKRFGRMDQYDLVLTTYALLPRDEEELLEHEYHLLILDESQYIKNTRSKASQIATTLRARHRLCLTGTPLENHLGELWSQFHFLLPGLLGNEKTFNSEFRHPIEKLSDENRKALLARRIRPFLLRRTKDKVADELPPKTEMIRNVDLYPSQRDIYETIRLAMDKKIRDEIAKKGLAKSQIMILDALLKLRQVCCDPRLLRGNAHRKNSASAKLAALMEMVDELMLENRRILIFSQFTSMLTLIEAELKIRNISYAVLTGDTTDRASAIRSFQEGQVSLFLISLKAGGVGLNLTAADTVIHYDPWWNPAVENQATDRAWRIGQDKPVFVYKLIARGTLEEKIQELQQKKADLADAILSTGEIQNVQITPEDLQTIFEPLKNMVGDEVDYLESELFPSVITKKLRH